MVHSRYAGRPGNRRAALRGGARERGAVFHADLIAGEFPGDGLPKPVAFPDPAGVAVEGGRFRILSLHTLVELKLASGMSAPHRLKDLADVLELVRAAKLPADLAASLDPSVRDKYLELWRAAQIQDPE